VRSELSPTRVEATGLFAPAYVQRMLAEHAEGRADRSIDLWKMLNVLTWWRLFAEGEAPRLAEARSVRGALPVA
jgi:hypothetical protein